MSVLWYQKAPKGKRQFDEWYAVEVDGAIVGHVWKDDEGFFGGDAADNNLTRRYIDVESAQRAVEYELFEKPTLEEDTTQAKSLLEKLKSFFLGD